MNQFESDKHTRHYWRDIKRQRILLEAIGKELGVAEVSRFLSMTEYDEW